MLYKVSEISNSLLKLVGGKQTAKSVRRKERTLPRQEACMISSCGFMAEQILCKCINKTDITYEFETYEIANILPFLNEKNYTFKWFDLTLL